MSSADLPNEYHQTLEPLNQRVNLAQIQVRCTINTELIQLY